MKPVFKMKSVFRLTSGMIWVAFALTAVPVGAKGISPSEPCPAAAAWTNSHNKQSAAQKLTLESIRPSDPALAEQLAHRAGRDQAARHALISKGFSTSGKPDPAAWKKMLAVDESNLTWLKPEIKSNGFPSIKQVGLTGVEDAWLLIQHVEKDVIFQSQVLSELKPRLKSEPFLRSDYAELNDRIRLAQGKKQIYGTQLTLKNGHMILQPTEDQAHLTQRRASMGLMPMNDYMCAMQEMYHLNPKR